MRVKKTSLTFSVAVSAPGRAEVQLRRVVRGEAVVVVVAKIARLCPHWNHISNRTMDVYIIMFYTNKQCHRLRTTLIVVLRSVHYATAAGRSTVYYFMFRLSRVSNARRAIRPRQKSLRITQLIDNDRCSYIVSTPRIIVII